MLVVDSSKLQRDVEIRTMTLRTGIGLPNVYYLLDVAQPGSIICCQNCAITIVERQTLEQWIAEGLTQRQIARQSGLSQTTVRYWLKQYELKTRYRECNPKAAEDVVYRCACGETDPNKFYGLKRSYCKRCWNALQRRAEQKQRRRIVEHLGGCCTQCGYDRYLAALDVHHVDPSTKDVAFGGMRKWAWSRVLKELQDCILLCKNCHSAHHAGQLKLDVV